jgi:hypothetical protein
MKRAYKDFVGQFDALTDADVKWTPYSEEAIAARRTIEPLDFVLPRPAVLDDEVAIAVRHVCGGVRCPQGTEAVQPLPGVACACGAYCSERTP